MDYETLLGRIERKMCTVCVVGLGYVGKPVALAFKAAGFSVLGYDVQPIDLPGIITTTDPNQMQRCEVFIVCVPTPVTGDHEPDLSHVRDAAHAIEQAVPSALVILESTVAPGDTERCFSNAKWLAFTPEREDPGSGRELTKIPKVVAGRDDESLMLVRVLYRLVFHDVRDAPDIRTAEMSKLIENTYRAVNIALANEFKVIAQNLGIDVWEAIALAKTKPFGFKAFYPGPGVGGHCIAVDPWYLIKAHPHPHGVIREALFRNDVEPLRVARQIKAYGMKCVLVVGMAYKKNIDDMRNSPARDLYNNLQKLGCNPDWYDQHVGKATPDDLVLTQLPVWSREDVLLYDAVVIATDHDDVDYSMLDSHPCVFDTRGILPLREGVHRI
jgi:UDP-N-acetyl-D-glucosamine dehydrogenase